jgi:hypothetical protein
MQCFSLTPSINQFMLCVRCNKKDAEVIWVTAYVGDREDAIAGEQSLAEISSNQTVNSPTLCKDCADILLRAKGATFLLGERPISAEQRKKIAEFLETLPENMSDEEKWVAIHEFRRVSSDSHDSDGHR